MNGRTLLGTLISGAIVSTAVAAFAGPADSPVPSISPSASTRVLYTVPGVIKNNGIETAIMCTSMDTVDSTIAFEVFAPEGGAALNNVASAVGNGTMPLPVGATVTISTGTSVGLHEDEAINGLANVKNGAARILGTSTRVLCTGILVEKLASPPATITTLKIFAQRRQNGD
jgi:hypothetical protein